MEVLSFYMSNIFFTPISVVLRAFVSTKFAIIRYVAPTKYCFFGGQILILILILNKFTGPPHENTLLQKSKEI